MMIGSRRGRRYYDDVLDTSKASPKGVFSLEITEFRDRYQLKNT